MVALEDSEWFRWAVDSILGFFALIYGAAIVHLYGRLEGLDARQLTRVQEEDKDIWEEIKDLRLSMEADRREASKDRQAIAERMVTRVELREQIDRVIATVKRGDTDWRNERDAR